MESGNSTNGKRTRSELEEQPHDEPSSSDDEVGPALPSAAPPKKKRKRILPHEALYVAALPRGTRYSRSLMHKDQLAFVTFTPQTDFLLTASVDGQVSFWKKSSEGEHVEFVKEFKAHNGELLATACSWDGRNFASCGKDGTIKIWDVVNFDLTAVISMEKTPACICWVHGRGSALPLIAVGNEVDGEIAVFDERGENQLPLFSIPGLHRRPVTCMAYHVEKDCVVSADSGGMVEYWTPNREAEKPVGIFNVKSETSLFDFKKSKSVPVSITMSPTGKYWASFSFPDRKIRLFDFASGRLYRTYDESIETIMEMQQAGTAAAKLENAEFSRRLAVERELDNPVTKKRLNIVFDETGHFILYGSLYGIKTVNTLTNRLVKVYGKEESYRSLNLTMYQGQPDKKRVVTVEMAASDNPLLQEAEARDAMLVTTGSGKVRFYMFTNEEEVSKSTRDVQNEKPRNLTANQEQEEDKVASLGNSAILHTTFGDIQIRLFPSAAPKAVENFTTHARNGYYNSVIFHRVIRRFMIQTGDPLGDGTGGESIWGKDFEDEISPELKHDRPYVVSMANAGPSTNASQFFITTERAPWLDGKHTIFGRAVQGLDVVHKIENARVRQEKPEEDIKIVNIDVA